MHVTITRCNVQCFESDRVRSVYKSFRLTLHIENHRTAELRVLRTIESYTVVLPLDSQGLCTLTLSTLTLQRNTINNKLRQKKKMESRPALTSKFLERQLAAFVQRC